MPHPSERPTRTYHQELDALESQMASVFDDLRREIDVTIVSGDSFLTENYQLVELISGRGPSFVFRARDIQLQRDVVLKLYRRSISDFEKSRVLSEGRAMARVNSPHVARCMTVDQHKGTPFLVMEYISGETLTEFAQRTQPDPVECVELLRQIAEGLKAAHAEDVLHLDLKPSNVMVDQDGTAKIIDFGLAKEISEAHDGDTSGTPSFIAPERVAGEKDSIGKPTDVFGLGGILYYLLTGVPPFQGETIDDVLAAARACNIIQPVDRVPEIPASINRLCNRCLQESPQRRFATAEQFLIHAKRITSDQASLWKWVSISFIGLAILIAFGLLTRNYWNRDGRPMPIPSGESIATTNSGLPEDFQLDWQLLAGKGKDATQVTQDSKGVYLLPADSTVQLQVAPATPCWLAVYGYEVKSGIEDLACSVYAPERDEIDFRRSTGMPLHLTFKPGLTAAGTTEYLYLVGFTAKWDPFRATQVNELVVEKIRSYRSNPRGLKEVEQISCIRIPFRVVHFKTRLSNQE